MNMPHMPVAADFDRLRARVIAIATSASLALAALALFVPAGVQAQGVRTVSVTATGSGLNEAEATQAAVINAVSMVSGERISASQTMNQSVQQRTDSTGQASEQVTTELRERINRLTRGVVKSWRVVGTRAQPEGTVQVTVSAQVAVYQASAALKRFKLAIVPGRMTAGAPGLPGSPLDALISGMTESLVASRKFAILDRRESAAAESEFRIIESRRVPVEELVRMQARAAADALVVVNPLVESVAGDPQRPYRMVVEVSVIDYASGQIKGSFSLTRRVNAEGARNAAMQMGRTLGNDVLEYAFPPLVIGVEADMLTIDAGDSRFKVGDVVKLFRFGAPLKDPATGESRGFTEIPMGEAKIVHATPMISVAQLDRPAAGPLQSPNGIVVRRAADKPIDLGQLVRPTVIESPAPSTGSPSSSNPRGKNQNDW